MNERVARLRKQSVETRPYISAERAKLVTEFYKTDVKPTWKFALMPLVVGFYEAQWETLDHDLAHLVENYWVEGGLEGIMRYTPALHRVVPVPGAVKREYILPHDEIVPC